MTNEHDKLEAEQTPLDADLATLRQAVQWQVHKTLAITMAWTAVCGTAMAILSNLDRAVSATTLAAIPAVPIALLVFSMARRTEKKQFKALAAVASHKDVHAIPLMLELYGHSWCERVNDAWRDELNQLLPMLSEGDAAWFPQVGHDRLFRPFLIAIKTANARLSSSNAASNPRIASSTSAILLKACIRLKSPELDGS